MLWSDTGWVSLTPYLASGVTAQNFSARRIGDIVSIVASRIDLAAASSGTINVATNVPATYRPSLNIVAGMGTRGGTLNEPMPVTCRSNGEIAVTFNSTSVVYAASATFIA